MFLSIPFPSLLKSIKIFFKTPNFKKYINQYSLFSHYKEELAKIEVLIGTNDFYDLVHKSLFVLVIFSHLFFTDQYLPSVPPPQFSNLNDFSYREIVTHWGAWSGRPQQIEFGGTFLCSIDVSTLAEFRSNIYSGENIITF